MLLNDLRAVPATTLDTTDVALVTLRRAHADGLDDRTAMEHALKATGIHDVLAENDELRGEVAELRLRLRRSGRRRRRAAA